MVRASDPAFGTGCGCSTTSSTSFQVRNLSPPGVTYYYLVRAAAPNRGSIGVDSAGVERSGSCLFAACGFCGL